MIFNPAHVGSDFDAFLQEEGMLEEATVIAIKRVLAWQITKAMAAKKINKTSMAQRTHTSRSYLNRLLEEQDGSLTLSTLVSAAQVLGKKVKIELLPA